MIEIFVKTRQNKFHKEVISTFAKLAYICLKQQQQQSLSLLEGHLNLNFKTDFQFEALCMYDVCVFLFLTLCDPRLLYGILQAQILEWVAISYSRGCSPPRDGIHIACI